MKVVLAFATADAGLRAYLARNRDRIVPQEALNKGLWYERNARFSVQIAPLDHHATTETLGRWLRRHASGEPDAIVLIIDEDWRDLVADYEDAYFIVSRPHYQGANYQNELRALLAPVLRHLAIYIQQFEPLSNRRIFLLPLDVFQAPELQALRQRLTLNKMEVDLSNDLQGYLQLLASRARPKTKKKRFSQYYFVDDRPLYYRYGPERHARVETIQPPHHEKCWHNAFFRFGRMYDPELHHNVDDGKDPSGVPGQFITCHGEVVEAGGKTHIGVFPNGYI